MASVLSQKFLREHVFQILLTALVSLGGSVGFYLLHSIGSSVDTLECRVSKFGAKTEFNAVQLKLIVTPLDDVSRGSQAYTDLTELVSGYKDSLGKCPEGRDLLAQLQSYYQGLAAFTDRDWEGAIANFKKTSDRTALTEKSLANAMLHKYLQLKQANNQLAPEYEAQWRAHIAAAQDLASKESDYLVKERAVSYLRCSGLLVDVPASDAIDCLKALVKNNLGSYAVHYNLAALYSRSGQFAPAIEEMRLSLEQSGGLNQRRSEIEHDEDFKKLLEDSTFGLKLKQMISPLPF